MLSLQYLFRGGLQSVMRSVQITSSKSVHHQPVCCSQQKLFNISSTNASFLSCQHVNHRMQNAFFRLVSLYHSTRLPLSAPKVNVNAPEVLTTKRIVRKRKTKDSPYRDQEVFDIFAYCTADKYNLKTLSKALQEQALYGELILPEDMQEEAIYVEALYGIDARSIFFFKDGATIFWNMPEMERSAVLSFLVRHQEKPYNKSLVEEEYEKLEFSYQSGVSQLQDDGVLLRKLNDEASLEKQIQEKYAFSNSLGLSVSLSIWEALLDQYVESIEFILQDMKEGKRLKLSEHDVLRKAGQLLTLRHLINLRSDLLDTPDPFWDREDLELIYTKTCQYLDITRRTRVMNEKLNHCTELTTMLQEILKDKHHTRLEWMIIILILIEVIFEIVHTYERWYSKEP